MTWQRPRENEEVELYSLGSYSFASAVASVYFGFQCVRSLTVAGQPSSESGLMTDCQVLNTGLHLLTPGVERMRLNKAT